MAADESDERKGLVSRRSVLERAPSKIADASRSKIAEASRGLINAGKDEHSASESTGDPLRDAIIAQGKADHSVRNASNPPPIVWQPPTVDEFNEWERPKSLLDELKRLFGDERTRRRYVLDRLKSGVILAAARVFQLGSDREDLMLMSPAYWNSWDDFGEDHFWKTGDARFNLSGLDQRFLDVRFNPKWDLEGGGKAIEPHQMTASAKPKGGAPRKGWWDDLWIEMIRRIRADELHPASGNDLKRIMEEWLADREIYPGDDTLKKTANKLFKYLHE